MAHFCSTSNLAFCTRLFRAFLRSLRRWRPRPSLGQIAKPEDICWISLTAVEQVLFRCFLSIFIVTYRLACWTGWSAERWRKMWESLSDCDDLWRILGDLECVLRTLTEVLAASAKLWCLEDEDWWFFSLTGCPVARYLLKLRIRILMFLLKEMTSCKLLSS